jgi:hypothetical protein
MKAENMKQDKLVKIIKSRLPKAFVIATAVVAIVLATAIVQTATMSSAFAGSEIGKGGNGGSRAKLYHDDDNSRAARSRGGHHGDHNDSDRGGATDSRDGGGHDDADSRDYDGDLLSICHRATGLLRDAMDQAIETFNDGDVSGARNMLMLGLREASQSFNPHLQEKPLLQNAIVRGLALNSVFQNACPAHNQGCLNLEARAAVYFLSVYYGYILNTVSSLDENYYVPYMQRRHHNCRSFDCLRDDNDDRFSNRFNDGFVDSFFTNYKDAAVSLLGFYNGNNSSLPDALARNTYELRLAELVLGWAADDLNTDLFRRHFACAIAELDQASRALADFNAGNSARFRTSTRAVQFARRKSENIAKILSANDSCVIYPSRFRN